MRVIDAPRGRGQQMNAGVELATGDVLLFLHADTRLPDNALKLIEETLHDAKVCGGNFGLTFDGGTCEAKLLTKLYPLLRLGGMYYGDSAIFVRREVFERLGGYCNFPFLKIAIYTGGCGAPERLCGCLRQRLLPHADSKGDSFVRSRCGRRCRSFTGLAFHQFG